MVNKKLYEINVYGPTFSADGKVNLAVYAGFGDPIGIEREPSYVTSTDLPVAGYYDEWYCIETDEEFNIVTHDQHMPAEVLEIINQKKEEISW